MCDLVYAMAVQRLEGMAVAALAAGAEVDPQQVLLDFDAELDAPLATAEPLTFEQAQLRRSLGVA